MTVIVISVSLLSACSGTQENNLLQRQQGSDQQIRLLSQNTETIPFVNIHGKQYIPVNALVKLLEFQHQEWDSNTHRYSIGDIDVVYEITENSKTAVKEGTPLFLSDVPTMINGHLHMSLTDITEMFQEEMNYTISSSGLTLLPSMLETLDGTLEEIPDGANDPLSFEDDPNDPFAGNELDQAAMGGLDNPVIPASYRLKNINMNRLISTGKKYMGVPYKFGAAPYPRSKRFDCSSYTQYLFGKYGVKLPRNSRQQFRVGHKISRKNLRKGDLMFFYVPGRFRSNKVVGHVGIYMGNGLMLDSLNAPKDGVQIRSINKPHWKKTYLGTRRVAY
jgi:hypothetical protein